MSISNGQARLTYEGADGRLTYEWDAPAGSDPAPLGRFRLRATRPDGREVVVPLGQDAEVRWTESVVTPTGTVRQTSAGAECHLIGKRAGGQPVTLRILARLEGKSLVLEASCDAPVIAHFDPGRWGPVATRRLVAVPYYSRSVEYLPGEDLFAGRFLDWTASSATRMQDARSFYEPLTDGSRHLLQERAIFAAAWHLDEVLPNIPNPPSPYRAEMGRRMVLDIWDGRAFTNIARDLESLADLGVRNDFLLLHTWQCRGYDNALPQHWPARAESGGEEGMRALSGTARRLGYRFALHENYVDYYPNYEGFNEDMIARRADGSRMKAWLNEGTGIQSFAVKPAAMLALAREQSPEIHRRYGTTASFLDVSSCVLPWFHVDQRAGEPGAGRLRAVWDAHRALWAYLREAHEGPVTGEGNNHWAWSGWLDGAEAQFGSGWPQNRGRQAPLLVDFNLLRIHPLQLNHGQGYFNRWVDKDAPWQSGLPMVVLDQYRMQEAIFGHGAFVGDDLWRTPGLAWLEHHLMTAVARRHATNRVADIRYWVNGAWVDTSAAAKADRFTRVRVTWSGGLTITANSEDGDWTVDGFTLPPFGWIAQGQDFAAGTVRREGVVVDFVQSPELLLANARRARDFLFGAPLAITPAVTGFQSWEDRRIRFSYDWKCGERAPAGREPRCYVHFDQPVTGHRKWAIRFQQDHDLPRPLATWAVGDTVRDGPHELTVPADQPDGRYTWFIGLFDDRGRLALDGPDDGERRLRLGDLVVEDGGRRISFEPLRADSSPRTDWFRRQLNVEEKAIDFGFVRTSGGVALVREGAQWKMWPYPRAMDFTLELKLKDGVPVVDGKAK